jgi:DNA replication and repair protein RecF
MGSARHRSPSANHRSPVHSSRYISRLRLTQFRNYQSAALDLDARHVVLIGRNGAGKTNLLEAISLLAPDRGLRRAPFEELAAHGSDGSWAVAATVEAPAGPAAIGTGFSAGEAARKVRINGAPARRVEEMSDYLRLLWLTPAMDGLFSGPAGDRRRFLDRLVTTLVPQHSATVADYERAMRQRNRLLEENADPIWIGALEAQMAELAAAVHFARIDCIAHLSELIAQYEGSEFPAAGLALGPLFPAEAAPSGAAGLEAELRRRWADGRGADRAAGRTLLGPHRVDFEVRYAQKDVPAALGSTGEQKALLVGLILAHARLIAKMTGITPILLLDEIAAHLDAGRRAALFATLDELGTQCFMTGTDELLFESLGETAQRFLVRNGHLRPLREHMPSSTYELFRQAMADRRQIVCEYDGLRREICPTILGHSDKEEKALVFQFGGDTTDGPVRPPGQWKCLRLTAVGGAEFQEGPWRTGERHSAQTCVKEVDFDVNPDSPYNPRFRL